MPPVEAEKPFESHVPTIQKYAKACLGRCPDKQSLALTLAWYYWSRSDKKHLPASVWARVGVRHVLAGRDLPGVQSSKFRDAMKRRETQGAGMEGLADRRPGPLKALMLREEAGRLLDGMDEFDRRMADLLLDGLPAGEVARRLRRSAGRVSQRRRRLAERFLNG